MAADEASSSSLERGVHITCVWKRHQTLANINLHELKFFQLGRKLEALLINNFPFSKQAGENDLKDLFSLLTAECVEWEQTPGFPFTPPPALDSKVSGLFEGPGLISMASSAPNTGLDTRNVWNQCSQT